MPQLSTKQACTLRVLGAGLLMTLGMCLPALAEVRLRQTTSNGHTTTYLSVEGTIADHEHYSLLIDADKASSTAVSLNSRGGSVSGAMALGRLLRDRKLDAIVLPNSTCASACVLVLAGAATRIVFGSVLMHRPFVPDDSVTNPAEQKSRYARLEAEVKDYLREMNVNPSLFDDMMRISSTSARKLTERELQSYGLSGTDPFVDEAQLTRQAQSLRISKQELIARTQRTESECGHLIHRDPNGFGACSTAVMYGISLDEYRRRDRRAEKACAATTDRAAWATCHTRITRGF